MKALYSNPDFIRFYSVFFCKPWILSFSICWALAYFIIAIDTTDQRLMVNVRLGLAKNLWQIILIDVIILVIIFNQREKYIALIDSQPNLKQVRNWNCTLFVSNIFLYLISCELFRQFVISISWVFSLIKIKEAHIV